MKALQAAQRLRVFLNCFGFATIGSFLTCCPGHGQQNAQLLKITYDTQDYYATVRLASDMITRNSNDALAHYYLGIAMARLGKADASRKALSRCLALSKGTQLGKLAERGLFEMSPYDLNPDKNIVDPQLSASAAQERQRLLDEQEREMKEAERRFDQTMNELQKTLTGDQLRSASQKEFETLSREQIAITERYQRRADAILRRGTVPDSGGQALAAPYSSSPNHVQNYVNPGDPSQSVSLPTENPLSARALKLGERNDKSTVAKKKGKVAQGQK